VRTHSFVAYSYYTNTMNGTSLGSIHFKLFQKIFKMDDLQQLPPVQPCEDTDNSRKLHNVE
jgi:hypothetical protein